MSEKKKLFSGLIVLIVVLSSLAFTDAAEVIDDDDREEQDSNDRPVVDIPDFVTSSSSRVRVRPGETLRLTCQVNNHNVPLMWQKLSSTSSPAAPLSIGGKVVTKHKSRVRVRTLEGNKGESLALDSVTDADAGHYECKIMDVVPKSIGFDVRVTDEAPDEDEDEEFEDEEVEVHETSRNAAAAQVVTPLLRVWCFLISFAKLLS